MQIGLHFYKYVINARVKINVWFFFYLKKSNVLKMIFFFFYTYFTLFMCNCGEDACFISNCQTEEQLLDLNFTRLSLSELKFVNFPLFH